MSSVCTREAVGGGSLRAKMASAGIESGSVRELVEATGVVWQGFHHSWEYNHRLNRLGSYVEAGDPAWTATHTAASGSGEDTARFEDRWTVVEGAGLSFETGVAEFSVQGGESDRQEFGGTVEASLDVPSDGDWTVVLNGFDVLSEADADKLMTFEAAVAPEEQDGDRVTARVSGAFQAACKTPECKFAEDSIDYTIRIYFLAVAGSSDAFGIDGTASTSNDYSFDRDNEISQSALGGTTVRTDDDGRVFGVARLAVDVRHRQPDGASNLFLLNADAVHLLELDLAIDETRIENGGRVADCTLFFKNWDPEMPHAFALQDSGEVSIDLDLRQLRFPDATIESGSRTDSIRWEGGNADADDRAAMRITPIDTD